MTVERAPVEVLKVSATSKPVDGEERTGIRLLVESR